MRFPIEYGLIGALCAGVIIVALVALGPSVHRRLPVCPAGAIYSPIQELCITGASKPVWQ